MSSLMHADDFELDRTHHQVSDPHVTATKTLKFDLEGVEAGTITLKLTLILETP